MSFNAEAADHFNPCNLVTQMHINLCDDVTGRHESVSCHDCRHVSITMKNYRPEMVLGGCPHSPVTEGGLAIRVGSFSGKPVTPKVSPLTPLPGSHNEQLLQTVPECFDEQLCSKQLFS